MTLYGGGIYGVSLFGQRMFLILEKEEKNDQRGAETLPPEEEEEEEVREKSWRRDQYLPSSQLAYFES